MHEVMTLSTIAAPEKIWNLWTDVARWNDWDRRFRKAEIKGPFSKNTKGTFVFEEGSSNEFLITSCDPGFAYTCTTNLPFAKLHLHRYLGYHNQKTTFTHEVWMEGPLSGIWWLLLGKKFTRDMAMTMDKLKQIAEN
jgi:hypothetical protein